MSRKSKIEWTGSTWHEKIAAARIGITVDEYITRKAMGQKWCIRCREWHQISFFSIDRSRGDGLKASCRNNTRHVSAEAKRLRKNAAYRAYYAGKGGPGIRASKIARKRSIDPILPQWREFLMETFEGRCAYCDGSANTIDHLTPVSSGGESKRGNLVPACSECNSRKRSKPLGQFLEECLARGLKPSSDILNEMLMEYIL